MTGQSPRKILLVFVVLLALGTLLRAALLPVRWINPDEGPHLTDARFLLEGKTPVVDYRSRQPFYVAVLAAAMKLVGMSLEGGRLVPLLCTFGIALLVFWLGTRMGGSDVGLMAALFYLFAPLAVIWGQVVKTEPLAVLLATAAMAVAWKGELQGKPHHWLAAGVLAGLAFYVRQATLYVPLAFVIYAIWSNRRASGRTLGLAAAGYMGVVLVFGILFVPEMGFSAFVHSQLDPANIVLDRLGRLLGIQALRSPGAPAGSFRALGQPPELTIRYLKETVNLSAFLLPAWILSWPGFTKSRRVGLSLDNPREGKALRLLLSWTVAVVVLYAYHVCSRGFFTQYTNEVVVPLTILTGWLWVRASGQLKVPLSREVQVVGLVAFWVVLIAVGRLTRQPVIALAVGLSAPFAVAPLLWWKTWRSLGTLRRNVVFAGLTALVVLAAGKILSGIGLPQWLAVTAGLVFGSFLFVEGFRRETTSFAAVPALALFTVAGFWALSSVFAGIRLGPTYECIWSPQTLARVTAVLRQPENRPLSVLSGGMIWTLEAGNPPYGGVAHPTQFLQRADTSFATQLRDDPPGLIIQDGYTRRKFAPFRALLDSLLASRYTKLAEVTGSKYPVVVWRRVERGGE